MPLLTMKCPFCETKINVSSNKTLAYCPCCGQRIMHEDRVSYEDGYNRDASSQKKITTKETEVKVWNVSKIESGSDVKGIMWMIFNVFLFALSLSNGYTLLLFMVYLTAIFALYIGAYLDLAKKGIDCAQLGELIIRPSSDMGLVKSEYREGHYISLDGDGVRFIIEMTRLAFLNSESEREKRKSGEYFAEKYRGCPVLKKDNITCICDLMTYVRSSYKMYLCSENAYYEIAAYLDNERRYQWEPYIFEAFSSAEISEDENTFYSFRKRVLELDQKQL